MGDPIESEEVKKLRREMKAGQDALRREFKADEKLLVEEMNRRDLVIVDNNAAVQHAMQYMGHLSAELFARAQMLQSAIGDFNQFLALQPKSSAWDFVWDLAWATLATALPALRLSKYFKGIEDAAMAAHEVALRTQGTLATQHHILAKVLPKAHEITALVAASNDIRDKAKKVGEAGDATEIKRLDATKKPVKEIIQLSTKAWALLDKVLDVLAQEFKIRLLYGDTPKPPKPNSLSAHMTRSIVPPKESLLDLSKRLLPLPQFFTEDELDQIELSFLWHIISEYARKEVEMVKEVSGNTGETLQVRIVGLNNTQQESIVDMFGFSAKRGMYYNQPPVFNINVALGFWRVPQTMKMYFESYLDRKGY